MKKSKSLTFVIIAQIGIILILGLFTGSIQPKTTQDYVLLGWNDLGMHCSNQNFSMAVVLPPYNNLHAQVIRKGSSTSLPEIVTTNFTVNYEIPGNTYSVGKTNFWDYEDVLFGVNLPANIGLTGLGLSGSMAMLSDNFFAEGIPLTPFQDTNLLIESPFQLALLTLFDSSGIFLTSTQPVIPVSNEIGCVSSNCHSSEQNILNEHENVSGFNQNGPVLCASCHSSNALGTTGSPGLPSLSEVIHEKHNNTNDCYKCHPGQNTQCLRGAMKTAGYTCVSCHGSTENVAETIGNGREPWLQEPSCAMSGCHSSIYAEQPGLLFRQSKGHGGLYCSACHGSPHAIYPSTEDNDNVENIALQGFAGKLSDCTVCHGVIPSSAGPHGILVTDIEIIKQTIPVSSVIANVYPNPATAETNILFNVSNSEKIRINVINQEGKIVLRLVNTRLEPGQYQINIPLSDIRSGVYFVNMNTVDSSDSYRFIKL